MYIFAVFSFRGEHGFSFLSNPITIIKSKVINMTTRVAVMSIIVENPDSVIELNALLHTFSDYVIGRMGIPYRDKNINIISIAVDAPQNEISALSGKIGKLSGVSIKTAYSGVISGED